MMPRRRAASVRGANMVEYVIVVGLVALLCIAGFTIFGSDVNRKIFEQTGTVMGI